MQPFSKIVGVLAALGSVASIVQGVLQDPSIAALVPQKYVAVVGAVCVAILALSHSFNGDGHVVPLSAPAAEAK